MGVVTRIVRTLAVRVHKQIEFMATHPHQFQDAIFKNLINKGKNTVFGKEHDFKAINTHTDYLRNVPIHSYEDLRPYMERAIAGEKNVLWPGRPKYIVGTSGTTGGIKYIPLSKESLPYHYQTARNAVFNYCLKYGLLKIFDGKLLFLSGSPELQKMGGIHTGRLSGIVNHQVPKWLKFNQIPTLATNQIMDWEEKIEKIVEESLKEDMTMISGIPPWVLMYYEKLLERSGKKTIKELFPNYNLSVYGGVNFEPYKSRFHELIGDEVDYIDTYPSSEGFVAYQDVKGDAGLLLNVNGGVYFEFVPVDQINDEQPDRLSLKDVQVDRDYAIIMNNNAGLWASQLGDIVSFVSTDPYRLIIKGRTEQFISAFGEHVIARDVESAISTAMRGTGVKVSEFTVAPQVNPTHGGLPYHEWCLELEEDYNLTEMISFQRILDQCMQQNNFHYKDLIEGKVIKELEITVLPKGSIRSYLRENDRLGGQNKVPRLSNDRKIMDALKIQTTSLNSLGTSAKE